VNFTNAILIMTSNIGSHLIQELGPRAAQAPVMTELRRQFRPEFLNRLDEIVVFHALEKEHLARIVDIQLERLRARLAERAVTLEVTPAARERIAAEGYDPIYGARPLKRVIQRRVQDALALELLSGEAGDGDTIIVDVDGDEIVLSRGR
jgi:ATP-dependent Clp protease ATP-binding subunit ClpB